MKKIALIGMMGSGKTTLGKKLAEKLNLDYYCTDNLIEDREDMTISKIFETKGEKYFRQVEKEVVRFFSDVSEGIISTGGGVVLNEDNINILKKNGFLIILVKRQINNIINTLTNSETNERPLIKDDVNKLKIIYKERKDLYEKYSDIIIKNEDDFEKTLENLINKIEDYSDNNEIIRIKGKEIGRGSSLICLPITSKNIMEIKNDIPNLKKLNPDILELRIDYFNSEDLNEPNTLDNMISFIKDEVKKIPFILTCRDVKEGGINKIDDDLKIKIIKKFIDSDTADIIDIELDSKTSFKNVVRKEIIKNNKYIILSHHNFSETPKNDLLRKKILQANEEHADIVKIACKANIYDDVLRVFNVTSETKNIIKKPMVALAMGDYGKISRLFGNCFGSDITFAKGIKESAPGQMDIKVIRKIWKEIL